ncbi:hypothetical protein [Acidicapsa ligni]|uniref:hypothetical protein n=1 Tax=Acidicapsa ligni TaxID=542300 RepID=UPI0021E018B1|nr:hypothetical protein [Acidicapsa ligni]
MRKHLILVGLLSVIFGQLVMTTVASGQAQKQGGAGVPPIVLAGLNTYKTSGADEAMKAWSKGSRWEGNEDATRLATILRHFQESDGLYQSFEIMDVQVISPSTQIVYLALNFEKEPHFAKFVTYHSGHGWILLSLKLDFDVNGIVTELK